MDAPLTSCDAAAIRLGERLAIVDEINDDAAHELALAAIQLSLLSSAAGPRPPAALEVAQAACQRSLDGVRRVRRALEGGVDAPGEPAPLPEELARLRAVAAAGGASLTVDGDLAAGALPAGLLLTACRAVEALLRFCAGCEADVVLERAAGCVRVTVECALAPDAWRQAHPDLERVRERVRWFDGELTITRVASRSRAVVALPA